MSIIFLFTITTLIILPEIFGNGMLIKDYYESFSYPRECLLISHYFPSGPLFLYIEFYFHVYSYIFGYESKDLFFENYFKKIDRKCNNSLFATTMFKDFRNVDILIYIYLLKYKNLIAKINYYFYKGISTGYYELWNSYNDFSVHMQIFDDIKEYPLKYVHSSHEIKYYLNSISHKIGYLCLVTTNNNAIVLNPEYGTLKPTGLITNFAIELYLNSDLVSSRNYYAFNCEKSKNYPNEPIIFIIDQPKLDIIFKVKTWKYLNEILRKEYYEFKIYNIQYMYVNYIEYVLPKYNKVFLMGFALNFVECHDGTQAVEFLSDNRIKYYVSICKNTNITLYMKSFQCFSHSLENPC